MYLDCNTSKEFLHHFAQPDWNWFDNLLSDLCLSKKSVNVLSIEDLLSSLLSVLNGRNHLPVSTRLQSRIHRLWEGCGYSNSAVRACMKVRKDGERHCRALCILWVKLGVVECEWERVLGCVLYPCSTAGLRDQECWCWKRVQESRSWNGWVCS